MQKNLNNEDAKLRRKARLAFLCSYWLGRPLPTEYHCSVVNLECCSLYGLTILLENQNLSDEAEVLLVEKFAESNAKLVLDYLCRWPRNDKVILKIVQMKQMDILSGYIDNLRRSYRRPGYLLPTSAQLEIVNSGDCAFLKKILYFGVDLNEEARHQMLANKLDDMFITYCTYKPKESSNYLDRIEEQYLAQSDNVALLTAVAGAFRLSPYFLAVLSEKKCVLLLQKYFSLHADDKSLGEDVVNSQNKKLIAAYIKAAPLNVSAQKKLIRLGYKDLLKLHYQKHGISEEALAYLANLEHFKQYAGI